MKISFQLKPSLWFRCLLAATGILLATSSRLTAQTVLAGWDFAGKNALANNPQSAATLDSHFTGASLTLGSGVAASNSGSSFTATGFNQTSLTDAINGGDYFSFTVTPDAGVSFTLATLAVRLRVSSGGATVALLSSATGFNASSAIWSQAVSSGPAQGYTIDLATALGASPLTSAIEFRFYGHSGTGTVVLNSESAAGNDMILSGTASTGAAVPEPSTYAALAGVAALAMAAWRRRHAAV